MKVYASRDEAEAVEGTFRGLSPHPYSDVSSAEFYYPDVRVFSFLEMGAVRVAWSDACEYCGAPIEEDRHDGQPRGSLPVVCSTCGEIANSTAYREFASLD